MVSQQLIETGQKLEADLVRLREIRPDSAILANYAPCAVCDGLAAGRLHRNSRSVWGRRAERARANDGTDPETGLTLADAEAHLAAMAPAAGSRA